MRWLSRLLNGWSGIGWNSIIEVPLIGGPTYHEIQLETNLQASDMVNVTVNLNGDPIYSITGEDLVRIQQYEKRYITPGQFIIPFSRIVNSTVDSREISRLVTFPTDNITLQITTGAQGGGPAQVTIGANVEVSASEAVRQYTPRLYRITTAANAEKDNDFDKLARKDRLYQRLWFENDISRMRIMVDSLLKFDRTAARNSAQQERNDRAPQDGFYIIDFIVSDFGIADLFRATAGNTPFDIRESLSFLYDIDAPGTVPILVEGIQINSVPTAASTGANKAA